jgi:predicted Zn-dependent protease
VTLTRSEAQAIVKAALKAATFKEIAVRVTSSRAGNLRFAANAPTTSGEVERIEVSVTATKDRASATVSGSARDAASLKDLVRRAEELAALAPVDPEWVAPLGPQTYGEPRAVDPAVTKLGPEPRTDMVARVLKVARDGKLTASGLIQHAHRSMAFGTAAGLFGYHADTEVSLAATMRTPDGSGSGWGGALSHRIADLDAMAIARRAADKATMSQGGGPALTPGKYTVVLEAQAVADLLGFLRGALQARAADEGRSLFCAARGQRDRRDAVRPAGQAVVRPARRDAPVDGDRRGRAAADADGLGRGRQAAGAGEVAVLGGEDERGGDPGPALAVHGGRRRDARGPGARGQGRRADHAALV